MTNWNQSTYDSRIDAMKARERDNVVMRAIAKYGWANRVSANDKRNALRLAAYKRKRLAYDRLMNVTHNALTEMGYVKA